MSEEEKDNEGGVLRDMYDGATKQRQEDNEANKKKKPTGSKNPHVEALEDGQKSFENMVDGVNGLVGNGLKSAVNYLLSTDKNKENNNGAEAPGAADEPNMQPVSTTPTNALSLNQDAANEGRVEELPEETTAVETPSSTGL